MTLSPGYNYVRGVEEAVRVVRHAQRLPLHGLPSPPLQKSQVETLRSTMQTKAR